MSALLESWTMRPGFGVVGAITLTKNKWLGRAATPGPDASVVRNASFARVLEDHDRVQPGDVWTSCGVSS